MFTVTIDYLLIPLAFICLLIASYTDILEREVPDWLNYGLIFAALGIRAVFAVDQGWSVILSGILGFGVCFLIACFFYYTHQWGGGDGKLLMGMGALLGITYPFNGSSFNLLWYFVLLMILGAGYGLLFLVVLAFKRRNLFMERFKEILKKYKGYHIFIGVFSIFFLFMSFKDTLFLVLAFIPLGLFYILMFVNSVEKGFFVRNVIIPKLKEGDWMAESIYIDGKKIMEKRTLEQSDMAYLSELYRKGGIKEVAIKEGIPFVPSFLFAYVAFIFGSQYFFNLFFSAFLG